MISVKQGLLGWALLAALAWADGVPMTISSTDLPATEAGDQQSLILRLKREAVARYLQNLLGPARWAQVEPQVTAEFAESYILEYQVKRNPKNRSQMDLSVSLNADDLKGWVRLLDAKTQDGGAFKPLLILASEIPEYTLSPNDPPEKSQTVPALKLVHALFATSLQKFNARAVTGSVSLSSAPKNLSDIRELQSNATRAGANGVLWLTLTPCPACGGSRVHASFFNTKQPKALFSSNHDVALDPGGYSSTEKVRKAFPAPIKEIQDKLGEMIAQGVLASESQRIIVEGVDSYRAFRAIDLGLGRLDFLVQATFKRAEAGIAEFEVSSDLPPEELGRRLALADFPGFQLKSPRIDNQTITVRYLK